MISDAVDRWLAVFGADGRRGLVLLALLLALGALALGGEPVREAMRYEREALGAGQWWRLLTAHAVHLDAAHALVNAAGLVLVWGIAIDELSPGQWLAVALAAALAVSAGLWWFVPGVSWYVGASGVLHGMLTAGVLAGVLRGDRVATIALLLLVLKLGYEQLQGPMAFTDGKPVVTAAHALGAVGGALVVALLRAGGPLRGGASAAARVRAQGPAAGR